MHNSVLQWAEPILTADLCEGSYVLEIGSQNVNGSLRPYIERHNPYLYIGTDLQPGPGVDLVLPSHTLARVFQPGLFELIICTEVLEHDIAWWTTLHTIRELLSRDGAAIVTTRSPGFPYHGYPDDFWRFTVDGLKRAFHYLGMEAKVQADPDPASPGVVAIVGHHHWNQQRDGRRFITGPTNDINDEFDVTRVERPDGV